MLVSICRLYVFDVRKAPVAIRRASFWMVWSFLILFGGAIVSNRKQL